MMKKFFRKQFLPLFLATVITVATMPFLVLANNLEDPFNGLGLDHYSQVLEDEDILNNIENRVSDDLLIDFSADLSIEELMDKDLFFYLEPDEQTISEATLDDDFENDAVIIVLNRTISRSNESFTASDFSDIGALYVQDLDILSDEEHAYAQELWEAERDVVLAENFYAFFPDSEEELQEIHKAYLEIREEAEENTLVNFDEYRRILLIRLDQNSKENVLDVIQQLQERDDVYWVGPNYIYEPYSLTPNDPDFSRQWAVDRLSLRQVWGINTGTSTVRVGIVGHGIDANHPELRGRVSALSCGSLRELNTGTDGRLGYGTRQAGIIGAMGNNGIGIAGIAWNVQLVSVGATGSHANGIANARAAGIPILTRSFSSGERNTSTYSAVRNFNGLFVNSAGNENQNTDSNPRLPNLPNAIIVGASNMNDGRSVWNPSGTSASNFGRTSVHLFAPGGGLINGVPRDIRTTHPNSSFGYYNGTSAAAPHVAGVAALVLSVNPNLTSQPQQVRNIILDSVDPVPAFANLSISGGRLNAYNAVRQATRQTSHVLMPQGFVNANYIPLRSGPGTSHNSITSLARNTAVTVLGSSANGSWLNIRVGIGSEGTEGWINNDRVTEASVQGFVNANAIPLRSGPGTGHNSITSLARNTTVTVLGSSASGSWLRIRVGIGSHGIEGWINDARVTEASVQGFVNANAIPLRSGPGTGHNSIASLARNTTVTVLGSSASGSWLRIRVGSTEGWINDARITEGTPTP